MKWLSACRVFGEAANVEPGILDTLAAFPATAGSPPPAEVEGFEALEAALPGLHERLAAELQAHLEAEVDEAQAAMFARRYLAVREMLDRLAASGPAPRLLRAGYACRLSEMLGDRPTALRVRALVDFYYSQAGILHHQLAAQGGGRSLPTLLERISEASWEKVTRGLFRLHVEGPTRRGPVHLNVLRFDRGRFQFRAVDCRKDAGEGIPFEQTVKEAGALAGFSGGFFLYSEAEIVAPARRFDPVGLLVSGGRVLHPPTYGRPAFVQDRKGYIHIVRLGLKGLVIHWPNGSRVHVGGINNWRRLNTVPVAFNRAFRLQTPEHDGTLLTLVGDVLAAKTHGGSVPIPVGGFVLALPPQPEWTALGRQLQVGCRVNFRLPTLPGIADVADAVAGGPTLLERGHTAIDESLKQEEFVADAEPATFSGDETGDQNLLPRLAIGITAEHEVIVLAADGRNFDRALGLTLQDTASVLRHLGAHQALNMDGGSSKRLVLLGQTLDLPTTEIVNYENGGTPIRPVHTAFLVKPLREEKR